MRRKSFCTIPDVGIGGGVGGGISVGKMLKFYVKVYASGKALSGELSCMRKDLVFIEMYSRTSMARTPLGP